MTLLEYILKSAACMGAFLLFYQFLLERENMHVFKRFFLLSALVASLAIPTLVFTEYVEMTPAAENQTRLLETAAETAIATTEVSDLEVVNWELLFMCIYGLGLLFFGFRFVKHLVQIGLRVQKNPRLKLGSFTRVLLGEKMPPHTFFKYIFLNKLDVEKKNIPDEVILHEETHAKQLHSVDVLFIELLQVLLWFNPLIYLFQRNIKLNHEFLADSAVLKKNVPTRNYQNTLLSYLSTESNQKYQSVKMANAINYSSIKKRFSIMKKRTSKKSIVLRSTLLIPLVAFLLYSFCEKKTIEKIKTQNAIEGVWLLQETEDYGMSIVSKDNQLHLFQYDFSFPIKKYNNKFYVISENYDTPLFYNQEEDILQLGSKKYIREANTLKGKFIGDWISMNGEMSLKIENYADGFVWNLTKDGITNKYYPKKNEKGFEFSYGYELWKFEIENGLLKNSNGITYKRKDKDSILNKIDIKESSKVGLSESELDQYNKLAKKYKKNHLGQSRILVTEMNLMYELYSKMTKAQQTNAKELYDFPKVVNAENRKNVPEEQIDLYNKLSKKYNGVAIEKRKIPIKELRILEDIYGRMTQLQKEKAQPFPECLPKNKQESATREQMREYNALARKYNEMDRSHMRIQMKEVEKLKYIYSIMSAKQRADAEPFPDFPKPPPPPESPKVLKGEASSNPPPPPPPPASKSPRVLKGEASAFPPPPPPPTPPDPLDHVIDMAKKGAEFYYEGKKISSDRAIELLKKNKSLNIDSRSKNSKKPIVRISKEPIKIGRVDTPSQSLYDYAKELETQKANFYLDGEPIPSGLALYIIQQKDYDKVETLPWTNKTPEVKIYSKA